jgi:hypothetical protein
MVELMILAGLISLVTIPLMLTFSSYSALESSPGYFWNQYTLGNIGGADAYCSQQSFTGDYSAFSIECPAGTVIDISATAENTGNPIYDIGIIPSTAEVNTYCMNSAFTDANSCSGFIK